MTNFLRQLICGNVFSSRYPCCRSGLRMIVMIFEISKLTGKLFPSRFFYIFFIYSVRHLSAAERGNACARLILGQFSTKFTCYIHTCVT